MHQVKTGDHAGRFDQADLIYRARIKFIGEVDFGISMEQITSGQRPIPLGGARFDQSFRGELQGPRVKGSIEGTDYLRIRADGRFELHLHARVTTEDGARIALASDGVSLPGEGGKRQLRSSVSLFTDDERYGWLNELQLWALGEMDPRAGLATIEAYSF